MSGSGGKRAFHKAAKSNRRRSKKKHPPPFSIRFTDDERARLNRDAGKLALSAYIRMKLFGDDVSKRKKGFLRKQRQPSLDHQAVAKLLCDLGQSELATSLIALSLAAQSGALPVDDELSDRLKSACDDIQEMRATLIVALNVKLEDRR